MEQARWETVRRLVGREAVAAAVVLATTFSGFGTQRAAAGSAGHSAAHLHRTDPAEVVFAFGDDLDAVNYELGFDADSRDMARLTAACQAVFTDQAGFEAALRSTSKAKAVAGDLLADAEPTIEACFGPQSADEDALARAEEGFAEFHERAFDFAAAVH